MNDGNIRALPPLGFDLMSQKPQRVDRGAGAMMTAICSSER
ncbi:hypothetical protein MJ579_23275 [Klebsiella pneumoniae]|nr:hypothetical protein MJ579_23275 [Klebsiella pneumoniae]